MSSCEFVIVFFVTRCTRYVCTSSLLLQLPPIRNRSGVPLQALLPPPPYYGASAPSFLSREELGIFVPRRLASYRVGLLSLRWRGASEKLKVGATYNTSTVRSARQPFVTLEHAPISHNKKPNLSQHTCFLHKKFSLRQQTFFLVFNPA